MATAPKGSKPPRAITPVKRGETLWAIAKRELGSGSRWRELAAANGISDPRKLRTGTRLKPVARPTPPTTPAPTRPGIPQPDFPSRGMHPAPKKVTSMPQTPYADRGMHPAPKPSPARVLPRAPRSVAVPPLDKAGRGKPSTPGLPRPTSTGIFDREGLPKGKKKS